MKNKFNKNRKHKPLGLLTGANFDLKKNNRDKRRRAEALLLTK